MRDFRRGVHTKLLQAAYDKYGEQGLIFKPIVECPKEALFIYEQWAMYEFCPEYNAAPKAGSQCGITRSEETINKIKSWHARPDIKASRSILLKIANSRPEVRDAKSKTSKIIQNRDQNRAFNRLRMLGNTLSLGKNLGESHPLARPVICIANEQRFDTVSYAAEWVRNNTKFSKACAGAICMACKGKRKTAYGYTWRYDDK